MYRSLVQAYFSVAFSLAVAVVQAAPLVVETDPLTPEQQRAMFHLPPGFEIQLVVADPEIGQPMNLNFDARGRLLDPWSQQPVPGANDKTVETMLAPFLSRGVNVGSKPGQMNDFMEDMVAFFSASLR